MPITRKPNPTQNNDANPVDVEALISRGGSVANSSVLVSPQPESVPAVQEITTFTVRIPKNIVSKIDQLREARSVKIPRHTWMMEAVAEKLKREEDQ